MFSIWYLGFAGFGVDTGMVAGLPLARKYAGTGAEPRSLFEIERVWTPTAILQGTDWWQHDARKVQKKCKILFETEKGETIPVGFQKQFSSFFAHFRSFFAVFSRFLAGFQHLFRSFMFLALFGFWSSFCSAEDTVSMIMYSHAVHRSMVAPGQVTSRR